MITELKQVWPNVTLLLGKPRHPQSQGSMERANGDIKDIYGDCMDGRQQQKRPIGRHQIRTVPEKLISSFRNKMFTIVGNI
jgi:hypothetical protein